ncbi:MAG: type 4a pilus biogenesis protein PilO [Candidatus Omnitrophota bacterium]
MINIKDKTVKVTINISIYFSIFIALHFFGARPLVFKPLKEERVKLEETKVELERVRELKDKYPEPKKKIKEIRKKMEEFEEKAVSQKELPRIIQQLTKRSSELNIEIISIRPIKDTPFKEVGMPSGVSKAYIEVVIKTTYRALGDYLKAIEELPTKFTVESLLVSKFEDLDEAGTVGRGEPSSDKLIVNLLISSYTIWKI